MRQTLAKIQIRCPYDECHTQIDYEDFDNHKKNCERNPDFITPCSYCEISYIKKDEDGHRMNCLNFIQFENLEKTSKIETLENKISELQKNQTIHSPVIKVAIQIKNLTA